MKKQILLSVIAIVVALSFTFEATAQFKEQGMGGGIGLGWTVGKTNLKNDQVSGLARGFIRYPFSNHLFGEFGAGFGRLSGSSKVDGTIYTTTIFPADYSFVFAPFSWQSFSPYLHAGAGIVYYQHHDLTSDVTPGIKNSNVAFAAPAGLGLLCKLSDDVALDMNGTYHYTTKNDLDGVDNGKKDSFWSILIGLTWVGESGNADPDQDGLSNKEEKALGTDPHNPDTDHDGISDGDEVKKYNTNPLKPDSDGDGLSDKDEIFVYHTDPNKADTDGDGLSDGDEVLKYHTDPLKADTDGDGLSDGQEVLKYHTDPLKADTDGDGLSDGDEVLKYHTDPLKVDTDGGTVPDGIEVQRGTNPLDASDDVPKKKEELKVEVGAAITLEGIVFKSGKAAILSESEPQLEKAYNTLAQNPEVVVEIQGHTDNVGNKAKNVKLSKDRAESVKGWLVKKGIDASRMTTKGFGPDKPIADNKTAEGKAKNRRIEFFRVK